MKGKIIVIEGTDCSGKETQSVMLEKKLNNMGIKCMRFEFPNYTSPTGKIVGGAYLGKSEICESYFKEGATNLDPHIACLYYAADRKYNIKEIEKYLNLGYICILDRYTTSNMAHQGGKIEKQEERFQFFKKIETLEFDILNLPKPDLVILLYVPFQVTIDLQHKRCASPDQNEKDKKHLKRAEQTYLELRALYHFKMVECTKDNQMRGIEAIHDEVLSLVKEALN